MISLLPTHRETFVSPLTPEEILEQFRLVSTERLLDQNLVTGENILFTGWVKRSHFRLSLKIRRPNSYMPLIKGRVEGTSGGCIVFVDYQLFPSTRMFITFWCLLIFMMAIITAFQFHHTTYGLGALIVIVFILWVAWSNFNIQLRATRKAMARVLQSR